MPLVMEADDYPPPLPCKLPPLSIRDTLIDFSVQKHYQLLLFAFLRTDARQGKE
jgi:hypothetical protein